MGARQSGWKELGICIREPYRSSDTFELLNLHPTPFSSWNLSDFRPGTPFFRWLIRFWWPAWAFASFIPGNSPVLLALASPLSLFQLLFLSFLFLFLLFLSFFVFSLSFILFLLLCAASKEKEKSRLFETVASSPFSLLSALFARSAGESFRPSDA